MAQELGASKHDHCMGSSCSVEGRGGKTTARVLGLPPSPAPPLSCGGDGAKCSVKGPPTFSSSPSAAGEASGGERSGKDGEGTPPPPPPPPHPPLPAGEAVMGYATPLA